MPQVGSRGGRISILGLWVPRPANAGNSFIITGRGGLPPNPREVLKSHTVQVDWVTLDPEPHNTGTGQERNTINDTHKFDSVNSPNQIVEAQGWVVDKNGDVFLVGQAPHANPHSPFSHPVSCSG